MNQSMQIHFFFSKNCIYLFSNIFSIAKPEIFSNKYQNDTENVSISQWNSQRLKKK